MMNVSCDELANAVKIGIVIIDKNFNIVDINREILIKGGVSRKDLINSNFLKWFPKDRHEELKKILEDTWNGVVEWGRGSFEILSRKMGKSVYVDIRVRRLKDTLIVTMIDKTWLYETLGKMNIIQSAVDHMAEGLVVTDVNGSIIYVNPGFTKITGYSYEDVIGENPRILKSGKHDKKFYEDLWNTILSGKIWHGSLINKRKDGRFYWEEMTIVPIKDGRGNVINFVAVKRDITSKKELEIELEKREEYYRKIFDMSNDGIFIETLDGKLIDVNDAGARMLGYTREELLSAGLGAIMPSYEKARIPKIIESLKKKGELRIRVNNLHKNGTIIPIELSISILKLDGRNLLIAIARDLSYREEQEMKYRLLSEMATDGVILIDSEGKIEYWNPACEKIFGYSKDEAMDKFFWDLIVPDEYLSRIDFKSIIKSSFKNLKGTYTKRLEVKAKKKNKSNITIDLGVSVFEISRKKYALAVIRDISERSEMEERIKKQRDELNTVYKFSLEIGSTIDLKELSEKVHREIKNLLPFDTFTLGFVDHNKGTIRYDLFMHKGKNIGPIEIKIDHKNSLSGWVITNKKPLLIKDTEKEKDNLPAKWISLGDTPRSWLGVPLIYRGEVVGIILLQSFEPNLYDEHDVEFLNTLGAQISMTIINANLYNELKLSEQRYKSIVDSAIVGITSITPDGHITFVNKKMADMLGYSYEELLEKNILDLTTERGRKIFKDKLKRRLGGASDYYENELIKKDGSIINALIHASPLKDLNGNIVGSLAVVMDITDQKKKEMEIRKKNDVLSALYNISLKMGKAPTLKDLCNNVYTEIKNIFDLDWFFINIYEKDKGLLKYEILKSKDKNIENYSLKYDVKKSLSAWVIKTGKSLIIKDLLKEKLPTGYTLIDTSEKTPRSIIILPLQYENEIFGVISIQHKEPNKYTEDDVRYLTTIANALSILIKNIQLYTETKRTKDRLETIINTSIVGISTADLNGKLNFVNSKFAEMLGYSREELIGKNVLDLTTPEGRKVFKDRLEKRAQGISDYYENVLVRKDGKLIYALINASPINDENGKPIGAVGILLDITKRKEMEQKLLEEKERYKELFESMANIIVLIQNGKIIYINKSFEKSTGYTSKEIINRSFIDFVHPDMRDIVLTNYRRRMRGLEAPEHYIIKLIGKSGKEIWMDIRSAVIKWEHGKADLVSMMDITELKDMEDKLITLDEISRRLKMAKSRDEVYEIALENLYNVLELYNSAILELRGEDLIIAKSRGYVNRDLKININSDTGVTAWVARNNLPYYSPNTDEDPLYIEGVRDAKCEYATPISIEDKVYGVLDVQKNEPYSISEDDTKLIDLLANNMAVALKSLENQQELEKSKNIQELMLHIVSHDLKNPLAVLNGYVDLLREEYDPEYLDAMSKAIEEASNIIEKARLFSKLGVGKIDQEKILVDLKKELEEISSLLSHKYPDKKLSIKINNIQIYAFPLLREVFVNLIDNAFKYGATEVTITADDIGEMIEIHVIDNGPGIPDNKKDTIFNAFETLSQKKGSGLGLTIVKMIVELHDGSVNVNNNKPHGSIFVIKLPKE